MSVLGKLRAELAAAGITVELARLGGSLLGYTVPRTDGGYYLITAHDGPYLVEVFTADDGMGSASRRFVTPSVFAAATWLRVDALESSAPLGPAPVAPVAYTHERTPDREIVHVKYADAAPHMDSGQGAVFSSIYDALKSAGAPAWVADTDDTGCDEHGLWWQTETDEAYADRLDEDADEQADRASAYDGDAKHWRDAHCKLDDDEQCVECGVSHTEQCHACEGRGFHAARCPESDETSEARAAYLRALSAFVEAAAEVERAFPSSGVAVEYPDAITVSFDDFVCGLVDWRDAEREARACSGCFEYTPTAGLWDGKCEPCADRCDDCNALPGECDSRCIHVDGRS